MLPGNRGFLKSNERKNIFYNSFPKHWKTNYKLNESNAEDDNIAQIEYYMEQQKKQADKQYKSRKQEHDKKKKDKDKKFTFKKGQGVNGGDSICRIHGGHRWKNCRLNPQNTKNDTSALQAYYARDQGGQSRGRGFGSGLQDRGFGRGFQGRGFPFRGFQGRGFQGRGRRPPKEKYYQYHSYPPKGDVGTVTTASTATSDYDAYANQAYGQPTTLTPPLRNWGYHNYYRKSLTPVKGKIPETEHPPDLLVDQWITGKNKIKNQTLDVLEWFATT